MKGFVSSFQSLGTVDGPGVRYVIFMQGCPLRCKCCHNPETWDFGGGKQYTTDELISRIGRYKNFFGEKGGVTVSGGEPLMQAAFVAELFRLCHESGITTCLDTSGCILNDDVKRLLSYTDTVLLDYKMTDEESYFAFSGMHISQADAFLTELEKHSIDTWLRQVIIEGINDSEESVKKLYRTAKEHSCVKKVELLPFKKLCETKYDELGIEFPLRGYQQTSDEVIKRLESIGKKLS